MWRVFGSQDLRRRGTQPAGALNAPAKDSRSTDLRAKSRPGIELTCGVTFASIVGRGNVFATQFHPEKSAGIGLRIYRNFARLCETSRRRLWTGLSRRSRACAA